MLKSQAHLAVSQALHQFGKHGHTVSGLTITS